VKARRLLLLLSVVPLAWAGCRDDDVDRPAGPSEAESTPGMVRLSTERQKAVGLVVRKSARRPVRSTLPAVGWLIAKPEHEALVKSPALGYVVPPPGKLHFDLGAQVAAGYELGSIEAVLSPQEQAQLVAAKEEADTIIRQSQVSMDLARGQLERVRKAEGATAGTRLLELEETVRKAEIAHKEALERLPFLPQEPYARPPSLKPMSLVAPLAGRVLEVYVSPRQLCCQGDVLWKLADWSTLWVRVPVFQADLPRVSAEAPVQVSIPGTHDVLPAQPLPLPPSTSPTDRTVDLRYELSNAAGRLHPGQAVSVTLPVGGESVRTLLPRSAVLWDLQGGTWVYLQASGDSFRRARVELGPIVGDEVVVERGLEGEVPVVAVGAETLYGEEFHGSLPAAEDDD
jgi:membrane fusion protein, heavy metal efflux system